MENIVKVILNWHGAAGIGDVMSKKEVLLDYPKAACSRPDKYSLIKEKWCILENTHPNIISAIGRGNTQKAAWENAYKNVLHERGLVEYQYAFLVLQSWAGVVGYAYHYYAYIQMRDTRTDVYCVYTAAEAAILNRQENMKKGGLGYTRVGTRSMRMMNRDRAIECGLKAFLELNKDGKFKGLLLGRDTSHPVELVWHQDQKLLKKMNRIWKKYDSFYNTTNNPWPEHRSEMKRLEAQWEELAKGTT
jgi:hypothetical protein